MIHLDHMTYGYELELGDVDRRLKIPPHLGKWDTAETDILNMHAPCGMRACDPLGVDPPYGGEVNVVPAHSPEDLTSRVVQILQFFTQQGCRPVTSCISHNHVHVRVPGLRDDIGALKRLTEYIWESQEFILDNIHAFQDQSEMSQTRTARRYLKWDGGRPMPIWMAMNIVDKAQDFDDFIRIQCCGKDGVSRGRPFRYMINTYCMKHTDTIEFRFFRASLQPAEIHDTLEFVRLFMHHALSEQQEPVDQWFARRHREKPWLLPKFTFNLQHWLAYEKTKHDSSRGYKSREMMSAT